MLAQAGVYANTGSACASKALKTSPVLTAIGIRPDLAQGSLVFTLDHANSTQEIDYTLETLLRVVSRLRMLSPIWGRKEPIASGGVCV
jgi:cysteine desulfurase